MTRLIYQLANLPVVFMLFAGSAWAQPAQNPVQLPFDQPTSVDGIETVCTGVGLEARQNPSWQGYGLKVEVAGKGGQYLGDVTVHVSKDGKPVLAAVCEGPWILFKLSPGRYQIDAVEEGQTAASAAFVPTAGQGRIILRFPNLGNEVGDKTGAPVGKGSDGHNSPDPKNAEPVPR